jgi:GNAT superfamily N-acetyltransferase
VTSTISHPWDGTLMIRTESSAVKIREATQEDNQELQKLQAACPQGTSLIVSTVNTPDFFARAKAYESSKVFVARDDHRIIGSAACAIREGLVGGENKPFGYGFQIFVSSDYRRKGVARQFHQHVERYLAQRGAVLFYCLIMEENTPSMRLVEHEGFKRYRTLVMPGLPVYREMGVESNAEVRTIDVEDLVAVARVLNQTWEGFQLYKPISADELSQFLTRTPGHGFKNLFVLEYKGEISACVGFWDWSQITRVTVEALSRKMRIIGCALGIAGIFRPVPRSLKPGQTLKQMVLTPIGFRDPKHFGSLVRHVNNKALDMGIEQIFCICQQGHPLLNALKGFIRIDTTMHLYAKSLTENISVGDAPVFIDGIDL